MKTVIVLGGGVAGMSAAHELIERGYEVHIYERLKQYVGGKARSIDYFGQGTPFKNPLPGEHGFRFFPGFYRHVTDTMKRIPFKDKDGKIKSVFDNLTPTSRIMISSYEGEPIVTGASFPRNLSDWKLIWKDMHGVNSGLSKEEIDFFAHRVWQLMTSSETRSSEEYEKLGWWEYLQADRFSERYIHLLVQGLTRTLVAARAEEASTKTGGGTFLQLVYCMLDPSRQTDRVLNGPTNDKWLSPWKTYLKEKGVVFHMDATCTKLNLGKGTQIVDAEVLIGGVKENIKGDYFILSTPVERAAAIIDEPLLKLEPRFNYIKKLSKSVSWMNGIQYYLTEDIVINKGHVIYCDTQWATTSISQVQFWKNYSLKDRGNGKVKGVLSVDISDWFSNGLNGSKPADESTRKEVAEQVWEQLKKSLNRNGKKILKDEMLVDWYLDRDIEQNASIKDEKSNLLSNREPLLVNSTNSWCLRPNPPSNVTNLFLASDYVRTFTDLATMEGANEAARRAVNCLLEMDNSTAKLCKIWPLSSPKIFKPLKWYDKKKWDKGLPWSEKIPWWLKLAMIPWTIICLIEDLLAMLFGFRKN